jgi:hypothetical protein
MTKINTFNLKKIKLMKTPVFILILMLSILSSCSFSDEKQVEKEEEEITEDTIVQSVEIISEVIPDYAFGRLEFGMPKEQVAELNADRQLLGKHNYNFSYSYNGDGELYRITIFSDATKAITFESEIGGRYYNLHKIISMKHGDPTGSRYVPSIFDVMNAGILWMNNWVSDKKEIRLGIRERKLDSYDVICTITETEMEKMENERLFRIRNKDVIEASEKF